tara:strand:- start:1643 stop:2086 length:444 start_codon:yes stop_codon:yes gene_type:complete
MMTTDDGIVYDRTLLGKENEIGTYEVSLKMITEFAKSTGETHPRYLGNDEQVEIIAPPTICNLFVGGSRPDIKLEFGDVSFFAGQSIESKSEIRPGDKLTATTKLDHVYSKTGRSGKMVFAVWQTQFKNQNNDIVALVNESFVTRNK